jgi:Fe2+ transport system protein B
LDKNHQEEREQNKRREISITHQAKKTLKSILKLCSKDLKHQQRKGMTKIVDIYIIKKLEKIPMIVVALLILQQMMDLINSKINRQESLVVKRAAD